MKPSVATFEQSTRNWLIAFAVLATFGMAAFGATYGAPWYWVLIPALPGIAALASWFMDVRSGWRIGSEEVFFYRGSDWDLRLRVEHILWAMRTPDSEGPDRFVLHLRNGSSRQIPLDCVGRSRELVAALEKAGIEVRSPT